MHAARVNITKHKPNYF